MTNSQYYSAELMVYFEKHRFLEIIRVLIVRVGLDRPLCLKHYLRKNFRRIANSVVTKNAIVHVPSQFDVERFVKSCLNNYNIPIIQYNTKGKKVNASNMVEFLHKFEKFCKKNGIQKKNKIYLNFPKKLDEVFQIDNSQSPPTHLIHVTAGGKVRWHFKDVLDFYSDTKMQVFTKSGDGNENVEDAVIPEVLYKIKHSPMSKPYDIRNHIVNRVVVIGRRGSGRKTQAKLLAVRYNLVYINIESLIQQTIQSKNNMTKLICTSFKKEKKFSSSAIITLLWKRLLQNDTLSKGWVMVGFPNCKNELQTLVEKVEVSPNGIVVLHCSKTTALRRLVKEWEKPKCPIWNKVNSCAYVEKEHAQYDQNIVDIYKYLKACKTRTIHVDGVHSICYVKSKIFALLERRMN